MENNAILIKLKSKCWNRSTRETQGQGRETVYK